MLPSLYPTAEKWQHHPIAQIAVRILLCYLVLRAGHYLLLTRSEGWFWMFWANPAFAYMLAEPSAWLYNLMDNVYAHSEGANILRLATGEGVVIGTSCMGIEIILYLLVLVLSFPGAWQDKLWFVPLGTLAIMLLNITRIASLAWLVRYHPDWVDINHHFVFQVLVYGLLFLLWVTWLRLSDFDLKNT
jgi:exosortase/archaeosortase family protein